MRGAVRSVRFHGQGDVRLETSAPKPLGPGEVRLRSLAVGVCGTDAHIVAGSFPAEPPVVLGHEVCGEVVEVAPDVLAPAVGDLVAVEPHHYCTRCAWCRAGREHLCSSKRGYGVRLDGGMADELVVPARIAYVLPPGTPPWIGALAEPLSCCLHAVDRLAPVAGEPLLVFGCGPAGAMVVALARSLGAAPVVAIDPKPARRDLALRLGADVALSSTEATPERLGELSGELGFTAVVDAVGSAAVLEAAVRAAGRGGRVLEFGVADPEERASVSPNELFGRELTLLGSVINPYTFQRAVALLDRLGLDRLRPQFFGLDQLDEALAAQAAGDADKVFLQP